MPEQSGRGTGHSDHTGNARPQNRSAPEEALGAARAFQVTARQADDRRSLGVGSASVSSVFSLGAKPGSRGMSTLKISEAGTVQFPMVKHAVEIGWTPISPADARNKRGGEAGTFFRDVLEAKLAAFNPWMSTDAVRSIVETLDALPPTIEGNHELLAWLRGERQWYDEAEKRHRPVILIDFEHVVDNA